MIATMRLTDRDAPWRGWIVAFLAVIVAAGLYLSQPASVTPQEIDLVPVVQSSVLEM